MKNKKGFTLAELLIVVAIIGVLVAVSIPIFTSQLEKSREATDLANMRSAKAAAVAEWMSGDMSGSVEYVYDAASGRAYNRTEKSSVAGYGKSSKPASSFSDETVTGTPNENGTANFVTVIISESGAISYRWGSSYGSAWSALSNTKIEADNWYGWQNQYKTVKQAKYNEVLSSNSAIARKEADIDILNAFANTFNSMTVEEAKSILGDNMYNRADKNFGILFSYQVDGSYSIRVTPDGATNNTDYLNSIGYNARVYNSTDGETSNQYRIGTYNYVDTFIFTSDQVIGTQNKDNQIRISFDEENGKITNTKVWINGLDNQGFVSNVN